MLEIRDLRAEETPSAVELLARGMRDNPLHVAAFGEDPVRRRSSLTRMFGAMFRVFGGQRPICALDDGTLVAVTGVAPAGTCQPTALQRLRIMPTLFAMGPRRALRVAKWLDVWGRHDLERSHSHLGPLAVDAHLQGQGIGSQLIARYTAALDADGEVGYLETDKQANVAFYERHGYVVTGETDVIGVPNWFMVREPRGDAAVPTTERSSADA
ncbi:MAG: GNAT family N-acetyltransferase [Solirubrobacteraceae bacterium]